VNRSGSSNIKFHHIKTIYKPLNNITTNNINEINRYVKINGSSNIEPTKYLNVWIVKFDNNLLGYAQFPWDLKYLPETDGVVISKYVFGKNPKYSTYNLNKTLVHEIGHWIGLYHNFQISFNRQEGIFDTNEDGILSGGEKTGDLVEDTPEQTSPTYGNPYKGKWPKSKNGNKLIYNMFMNFMDYSDDINLFMFTKEQTKKIRLMLNYYRPLSILNL
jgi:hypothetical protein